MDTVIALLAGLALAAALVIAAWWARGRVDEVTQAADTQILDAVWQVCDQAGWPGELGVRLRHVIDAEPHDPIPDVAEFDEPGGWAPPPRDYVVRDAGPRVILPATEREGTAS